MRTIHGSEKGGECMKIHPPLSYAEHQLPEKERDKNDDDERKPTPPPGTADLVWVWIAVVT